jgi:hypothetical protein
MSKFNINIEDLEGLFCEYKMTLVNDKYSKNEEWGTPRDCFECNADGFLEWYRNMKDNKIDIQEYLCYGINLSQFIGILQEKLDSGYDIIKIGSLGYNIELRKLISCL